MKNTELAALRERLLTKGAANLSDAELLGITLSSPNLARSLTYNPITWNDLGRADILSLPHIGPVRTAQLLALAELSTRITSTPIDRGKSLTCSDQVASAFRPRLARYRQEVFLALALDCKHRVIAEHEIAKGTLTSVEVTPREVFRPLVRQAAAAAIFIHNHPSGDPQPSSDDRRLCTRLCETGELLGIAVLDFIIVGAEGKVSFADQGILPGLP